MCFEAPLSINHVSLPGVTDLEREENKIYSSNYSFDDFLGGYSSYILDRESNISLGVSLEDT